MALINPDRPSPDRLHKLVWAIDFCDSMVYVFSSPRLPIASLHEVSAVHPCHPMVNIHLQALHPF